MAVVIRYPANNPMDRPEVLRVGNDGEQPLDLMRQEAAHLKIVRSAFPEDHDVDPLPYVEKGRRLSR